MPELTYIVAGQEKTAGQLADDAKRAGMRRPASAPSEHKTTHKRDEARLSLGFIVLGRPADYMDSARKAYASELSLHEGDPKTCKHPGMLDDYTRRWKTKNKPARISKRPYQVRDAADICAALALKSGYVEVEIEEILKT
jgi:hypothetical protein